MVMSRTLVTLRDARRALALLGLVLVVSMVWGASARAALEHPFTGQSFGPEGTGTFVEVIAVAVDQKSGDVFVYDQGEGGSVYKFDASGEPVDFSSAGTKITGVGSTGVSEAEIAVDSSGGPDAGDIYVANKHAVRIYSAAGVLLGELTGPEPCGVAVDSSGAVYVGNYPETVTKYVPLTNPVSNSNEQSSMRGLNKICNVAVDGEGNVYAATYTGGVTRYGSLQFGSLTATGTLIDPAGRTLAVDPSSNHVYVGEESDVAEYDSEGKLLGKSGKNQLSGAFGVAVKSGTGGSMYASSGYGSPQHRIDIFGPAVFLAHATTEVASNITNTSVTLAGSVNPEGTATTYQFEYGTSSSYGSASPVSPGSVGSDSTNHALEANLSALASSTLYHYRISATNENGVFHGADETFRTTGPPTIDAQSAIGLGQREATIEGQVNSSGFDTHYYVEYGPTSSYGSSTTSTDIGSETTDQSTSVELTGLHFGTTYHYRIVASNSQGAPVYSPDETFTTVALALTEEESISQVGSSSLTLSTRVNDFGVPSTYHYEYGQTNTYGSTTPQENLGAVNGPVGAPAQLSGLQPGTAYHFRIVVENEEGKVQGEDFTFSTLQLGILGLPDDRGYELVTPTDNEDAQVYTPEGSGGGLFAFGAGSVPSFLPVRAAADGHAIVYVGEPTSEGNGNQTRGNQYLATRGPNGWTTKDIQPAGFWSPQYWAFSEDLSTGVLQSIEPLAAGAPNYPYEDLYVSSIEDGSLHTLSTATPPHRSPQEFDAVSSGGGSGELGAFFAGGSRDYKHLFFEANDALTSEAMDGGSRENNLYESYGGRLRLVNVLPDGSTQPNASFGAPSVTFDEAQNSENAISADGSRAFWTDLNRGSLYVRENGSSTRLIAEHATFWTASADGSRVLYAKSGDLYEDDLSTGVTTDLTPGGQVQGIVGASEDASYVYFVADGTLAPGALAGESNLYLYHGGTTTLIATLSSERKEEPGYGVYPAKRFNDWRPALGKRTAEATPDGHTLAFMSVRSLTGYDNRNEEGFPQSEVFVYDAMSGKLSCASCSPSGERPLGSNKNAAGYLPVSDEDSTSQLRLVSEDGGRVLFQSVVPLVPQDVNGKDDVYEWERDGTGSCHLSAGCVYLLSDGSSDAPSFLLDASADGSNVFIATSAQLVSRDENEIYDVYDVRIGVETPPVPPQCTGTGCQGVPGAPPIFATPSSVTFGGVGNFAPAAKTVINKPKAKAKKKPKAKRRSRSKAKRKHRARKQILKGLKGRRVSLSGRAIHARVVTGTNGRGDR